MRPKHARTLLVVPALALAAACAPSTGMESSPAPAGAAARADAWEVPATPAPAPIGREEYARRRAALAERMDDGVLVAFGGSEPEADYLPFSQNSPFRYLTGINEPGAALLIAKDGGRVTERLFVLPRNPAREVWEGARLGAERAQALTGIPAATTEQLDAAVDAALDGAERLYTLSPLSEDGSRSPVLNAEQQLVAAIARRHPGVSVTPLDRDAFTLRAAKSPTELDLIRRAVYITVLAQRSAMRAIEPGMNEFEIHALIDGTFRRNGAERPAFASIVGSGPNSTTLHYRAADRFMGANDVVVMDIGAGYRGYAADVTRTVPVDGTFSEEQRAVYEIVLAAQKAAEQQVRPGATWSDLNSAANAVLEEGLTRLGLIDGPGATYDCDDGSRACPQYRIFYMHGLGHGIGLDVHDPEVSYGAYGGAFRERSAFTIEPGIYVRADALDYLPDTPGNRAMIGRLREAVTRYANIGVRIEDDYFVTADGFERVSTGAPREVDEIEALMALDDPWNRARRAEVVEWYRGTGAR